MYEMQSNMTYFQNLEKNEIDYGEDFMKLYKYAIGTSLAFWARSKLSLEKVLKFYKDIYTFENKMITIPEMLHKYHIFFQSDMVSVIHDSVKDYLNKFSIQDTPSFTLKKQTLVK